MHELCAALPGAWPDDPCDHEHPVYTVRARLPRRDRHAGCEAITGGNASL